MNWYVKLLQNKALLCSMISWFLAQSIKIVLSYKNTKRFDANRIIGSGGMPSSHTAFVMALATSIGKIDGWDSAIFAIALCFALVVMYDAAGVRRAAGNQAKILNIIIQDISNHKPLENQKLKELIGHTPKEVFAGAILGIIVANIFI